MTPTPEQAKAAASAARLVKAQQAVAAIASLAYSQGATGDTTMLYQGSDPAGFVDRAAIVDSLSRSDVSVLASVHAAQLDADSTARPPLRPSPQARRRRSRSSPPTRPRSRARPAAESNVLDTPDRPAQAEIRAAQIALAKAIKAKRAADIRRYEAARPQRSGRSNALQRQRDAQRRRPPRPSARSAAAGQQRQRLRQQRLDRFRQQRSGSSGSGSSRVRQRRLDRQSVAAVVPATAAPAAVRRSARATAAPVPATPAASAAPAAGSSAAATAVHWAYNELGKSYVYGAGGPNHFDCSGLTIYVYAKAGIYLPHSSAAQFGSGRHIRQGELASRRPGLLRQPDPPRRHLRRQRRHDQRSRRPARTSRSPASAAATTSGAVRVSG